MATTFASPPIQLRNTYPPGQPPIGAAPKLLGRTPSAITQIMYPDGFNSMHIQGPLVSGPMPGVQGAAGSALLTLTLQLDGSMGNFDLPIQFPGGSFLLSLTAVTYATGIAAGIVVQLGSQQGASDIGVFTIPALNVVQAPVTPTAQLPVWSALSPLSPFLAWLHVAANTASAGGTILVITYMRCAGPWSAPAK